MSSNESRAFWRWLLCGLLFLGLCGCTFNRGSLSRSEAASAITRYFDKYPVTVWLPLHYAPNHAATYRRLLRSGIIQVIGEERNCGRRIARYGLTKLGRRLAKSGHWDADPYTLIIPVGKTSLVSVQRLRQVSLGGRKPAGFDVHIVYVMKPAFDYALFTADKWGWQVHPSLQVRWGTGAAIAYFGWRQIGEMFIDDRRVNGRWHAETPRRFGPIGPMHRPTPCPCPRASRSGVRV